jgi:hypothetical protein
MMTKIAIVCVLILLSGFLIERASATNPHHDHSSGSSTNTTNTTEVSITEISNTSTGVSQSDLEEATSKAMACGNSYYMGTRRYQGAISGAMYKGKSSLCLGLGKVVGADNDVMINFNIVPDEDDNVEDWGYRGGVLFLF